ncbi:hypothetical protein HDU91_001243 [Kappamyces sp. JEL0680]|nr:hypothetical protein HDU91_001243 [Kappamyces sp. JEL0680]
MARNPEIALFGVGFSLGANVMTKFCGQKGAKNLYSRRMGQNLSRMFQKHYHIFKNAEWLDIQDVMAAGNIMEFDAAATAKQFGYKTVHEYYRFGSSAQDIPYIAVPTLFLSALDDPISNKEVIPYYEFNVNPNVIFASTSQGGHLGWFHAAWDNIVPRKRWFSKPCIEFIHAIIESHLSLPEEHSVLQPIVGHTGTIWQSLPRQALEARERLLASGLPVLAPAATLATTAALESSVLTLPARAALQTSPGKECTANNLDTAVVKKSLRSVLGMLRMTKSVNLVVALLFYAYLDRKIKGNTLVAFLVGCFLAKQSD